MSRRNVQHIPQTVMTSWNSDQRLLVCFIITNKALLFYYYTLCYAATSYELKDAFHNFPIFAPKISHQKAPNFSRQNQVTTSVRVHVGLYFAFKLRIIEFLAETLCKTMVCTPYKSIGLSEVVLCTSSQKISPVQSDGFALVYYKVLSVYPPLCSYILWTHGLEISDRYVWVNWWIV